MREAIRVLAFPDPAALFRSAAEGNTWEGINSLTNHPTRNQWFPGAGGMMVHLFVAMIH